MTPALVPPRTTGVVRIFLLDDTRELRQRVRRALTESADLNVVGEADDPVDGLPLIVDLQPDVVVCDLSMPRMDGLEAIPHIARERAGRRHRHLLRLPRRGARRHRAGAGRRPLRGEERAAGPSSADASASVGGRPARPASPRARGRCRSTSRARPAADARRARATTGRSRTSWPRRASIPLRPVYLIAARVAAAGDRPDRGHRSGARDLPAAVAGTDVRRRRAGAGAAPAR